MDELPVEAARILARLQADKSRSLRTLVFGSDVKVGRNTICEAILKKALTIADGAQARPLWPVSAVRAAGAARRARPRQRRRPAPAEARCVRAPATPAARAARSFTSATFCKKDIGY